MPRFLTSRRRAPLLAHRLAAELAGWTAALARLTDALGRELADTRWAQLGALLEAHAGTLAEVGRGVAHARCSACGSPVRPPTRTADYFPVSRR